MRKARKEKIKEKERERQRDEESRSVAETALTRDTVRSVVFLPLSTVLS